MLVDDSGVVCRLVAIEDEAWLDGGTPHRSYLIPWSVLSPQPEDVGFWIGKLDTGVVNMAVEELVTYLHPDPTGIVD